MSVTKTFCFEIQRTCHLINFQKGVISIMSSMIFCYYYYFFFLEHAVTPHFIILCKYTHVSIYRWSLFPASIIYNLWDFLSAYFMWWIYLWQLVLQIKCENTLFVRALWNDTFHQRDHIICQCFQNRCKSFFNVVTTLCERRGVLGWFNVFDGFSLSLFWPFAICSSTVAKKLSCI